MNPSDTPFWVSVDAIRATNPAFRREAYGFVMAVLSVTVQELPAERVHDPERRHLSGRELLEGILRVAREEFGQMAPTVFREWGVGRGEDWGAIVFQLVEAGQLSARPEDRLEDFGGGPDLMSALIDGLEWSALQPPRPASRSPEPPGGPTAPA
ncbi:MAG TPA: Minf_1886 family protein [Candidatus Limnocylindria bacterium]|nr:Minf_1886 family protein [Candidatus Limnocylindria bacterium]